MNRNQMAHAQTDVSTGALIVNLLSSGEYEAVWNLTQGRNLSISQMQRSLAILGDQLVPTPKQELANIIAVPCQASHQVEPTPFFSDEIIDVGFDFTVPLWTTRGRTGMGLTIHLVATTTERFDPVITGFDPIEPLSDLDEVLSEEPSGRRSISERPMRPPGENPVPKRWRPVLESVIHRLVLRDYAGLAADGLLSYTDDVDDTSIGQWIEEYGETLVDLPAEAWRYSEHGPNPGRQGSWWVVVDLWTAERGYSDLSLEATVWDDGSDVTIEVHNVHVM